MDYKIYIFSRNELKVIIVGTIIGGVLQIISWKYLKNHPDLLNNYNSEKLETKKPGLFPKSGALIEIAGDKLFINIVATIIYIAKKGALTGMSITYGGILIKKTPKNAISIIVYKASPIIHSDLEKGYILVDGKKIVLNECDRSFGYMFDVLMDKNIPFKYKKEISFKILMNHVDLKTTAGCIRFAFCIISIMHIFAINDISSYFILMENLIEAIKNGKISKRLARFIIRRLLRLKMVIDPELVEAAAYV
jgi:hypothetical protein